mmetsp:Transcript_15885/g.36290  ORF Transcript_15885/g.36290 Transcript_15885/m.36290 type:complete len:310 (+) Transcript_15885:8668-9597(+)
MSPILWLAADVTHAIALAPVLLLVESIGAHASVIVHQILAGSRLARVGRAIRGVTAIPLARNLIGHLLKPSLTMALVVIVVLASRVGQILARSMGSAVNSVRRAIVNVLALLVGRELAGRQALHVVSLCPTWKAAHGVSWVALHGNGLRVMSIGRALLHLRVRRGSRKTTHNRLALLSGGERSVKSTLLSEALQPIGDSVGGVSGIASDSGLLTESEHASWFHSVRDIRNTATFYRRTHSLRQDLPVRLTLGGVLLATLRLAIQGISLGTREFHGVLKAQGGGGLRRLMCARLGLTADILNAGGVGLPL